MGRLRDLQYICAVTYGPPSISGKNVSIFYGHLIRWLLKFQISRFIHIRSVFSRSMSYCWSQLYGDVSAPVSTRRSGQLMSRQTTAKNHKVGNPSRGIHCKAFAPFLHFPFPYTYISVFFEQFPLQELIIWHNVYPWILERKKIYPLHLHF